MGVISLARVVCGSDLVLVGRRPVEAAAVVAIHNSPGPCFKSIIRRSGSTRARGFERGNPSDSDEGKALITCGSHFSQENACLVC